MPDVSWTRVAGPNQRGGGYKDDSRNVRPDPLQLTRGMLEDEDRWDVCGQRLRGRPRTASKVPCANSLHQSVLAEGGAARAPQGGQAPQGKRALAAPAGAWRTGRISAPPPAAGRSWPCNCGSAEGVIIDPFNGLQLQRATGSPASIPAKRCITISGRQDQASSKKSLYLLLSTANECQRVHCQGGGEGGGHGKSCKP